VLGKPEDGRALRLAVAADAFKDAGAIVNDVAHDVESGFSQGMRVPLCQMLVVVWMGMAGFGCSFNCVQRAYRRVPRILVRVTEFGKGGGRCRSTHRKSWRSMSAFSVVNCVAGFQVLVVFTRPRNCLTIALLTLPNCSSATERPPRRLLSSVRTNSRPTPSLPNELPWHSL